MASAATATECSHINGQAVCYGFCLLLAMWRRHQAQLQSTEWERKEIPPPPPFCHTCFGSNWIPGWGSGRRQWMMRFWSAGWGKAGIPRSLICKATILAVGKENWTNTVLNLKYLHPCNPFLLLKLSVIAAVLVQMEMGVHNMQIIHLDHRKVCSWISPTDNEVICLRVARSSTKAGIH